MSHEILSFGLLIVSAFAVLFLVRGLFAYFAWSDRRFAQQLEAEFRAYCLVEEAKRQVRRDAELDRAVCALEADWAYQAADVAGELRGDRLGDATMCEAEWRHG